MAVTIDTGDPDNIQDKDKQPVGDCIALCALAEYYGKNVVYSGPVVESVERLPGSIRLHFAHSDVGLVIKETSPKNSRSQERTASGPGPTLASRGTP